MFPIPSPKLPGRFTLLKKGINAESRRGRRFAEGEGEFKNGLAYL